MCLVEYVTYIHPDGRRFQRPYYHLCADSRAGHPCSQARYEDLGERLLHEVRPRPQPELNSGDRYAARMESQGGAPAGQPQPGLTRKDPLKKRERLARLIIGQSPKAKKNSNSKEKRHSNEPVVIDQPNPPEPAFNYFSGSRTARPAAPDPPRAAEARRYEVPPPTPRHDAHQFWTPTTNSHINVSPRDSHHHHGQAYHYPANLNRPQHQERPRRNRSWTTIIHQDEPHPDPHQHRDTPPRTPERPWSASNQAFERHPDPPITPVSLEMPQDVTSQDQASPDNTFWTRQQHRENERHRRSAEHHARMQAEMQREEFLQMQQRLEATERALADTNLQLERLRDQEDAYRRLNSLAREDNVRRRLAEQRERAQAAEVERLRQQRAEDQRILNDYIRRTNEQIRRQLGEVAAPRYTPMATFDPLYNYPTHGPDTHRRHRGLAVLEHAQRTRAEEQAQNAREYADTLRGSAHIPAQWYDSRVPERYEEQPGLARRGTTGGSGGYGAYGRQRRRRHRDEWDFRWS